MGEADIVAQGPGNSLLYYFAPAGDPHFTALTVAGPGTTFSAPSIFVRSVDPVGEADIVAQGPNNLMYYFATPPNTSFTPLKVN